jgi:hypothetical protein
MKKYLYLLGKIKNLLMKPNFPPDNWHEDFIVHLAHIIKPEIYVELGIYKSELLNRISKIAKKSY